MKFLVSSLSLIMILVLSTSFTLYNNGEGGFATKNKKKATVAAAEQINWLSIEEAVELSKKEPRKVIVDVYASWCGWCKKMDKQTYTHPEIVKYINKKYYAVKLDAESRKNFKLGGRTYSYVRQGRGGANMLAVELLDGMIQLPSTVILDETFSKVQVVNGFLKAQDMDKVLHYFGDGYYEKKISQGVFERNFRSRIKGR